MSDLAHALDEDWENDTDNESEIGDPILPPGNQVGFVQADGQSPPTELPGLVTGDPNFDLVMPPWQTMMWDPETLHIMAAQLPFRNVVIPRPAPDRNQNPGGFIDIPLVVSEARGWRGLMMGASPQMEIGALRRPLYRTMEELASDGAQELFRHGTRVREDHGQGWEPEHDMSHPTERVTMELGTIELAHPMIVRVIASAALEVLNLLVRALNVHILPRAEDSVYGNRLTLHATNFLHFPSIFPHIFPSVFLGGTLPANIMQLIFLGRGRLSILHHHDGLSAIFPRIPIATWQLVVICATLVARKAAGLRPRITDQDIVDMYHQSGEEIRSRILDPNNIGSLIDVENYWIDHQDTLTS